jgi:hypothetical protein
MSSLAVMASMAYRRRVVDVETLFHEATGFSTAKYRKQFGASNYNLRQEELLRNILQIHDKGAVIVCSGSALEQNAQVLLQDFSRPHPVIHIVRNIASVHRYLAVLELSKLQNLVVFTTPGVARVMSSTTSLKPKPTSLLDPSISHPFRRFSPSSTLRGPF